jgi:hypothetical protein
VWSRDEVFGGQDLEELLPVLGMEKVTKLAEQINEANSQLGSHVSNPQEFCEVRAHCTCGTAYGGSV